MWRDLYSYDESSPSCLVHAKNKWSGHAHHILVAAKGSPAGSLSPNGYWRFSDGGRRHVQGHHIVWELHFGEIPEGLFIDHVDGNPSNCRVSNLRVVSQTINMRNKGKQANNSSGVTGVCLAKKRKRNGSGYYEYWVASVCDPTTGKQLGKYFHIQRLGDELAFFAACEWRSLMIERLNICGAGYTEAHGKRQVRG